MLDELTLHNKILLATGGGAVLREENRRFLMDRGIVVYLDTSVDLLVKRTAKDKKRPLLQNRDPRQVLEKIKHDRDPLYQEVADIRVFVGDNSSRKTVNLILQQLKKEGMLD
jgi:shikimate kinase